MKFKATHYVPFSPSPMKPYGSIPYEQALSSEAVGVLREIDGHVLWVSAQTKVAVVQIPSDTIGKAIETLYRSGLVEYAEPDYVVKVGLVPNDPSFSSQWGLQDTDDTDVDAPEAWDIRKGGNGVLVVVQDTGIDYTHEDLKPAMWVNPGETPGNGLDDDGNGWVDDVYGADFVNNDGDPMDDYGHGTHVAGIIGARGNNSKGISGTVWYAKIMALKFIASSGYGYDSDLIRSIDYLLAIMEANALDKAIVNASYGGGGYNQALYDAIKNAGTKGVLFIASAGNDGKNTDLTPHYPSSYNLNNIISVGASNSSDNPASFSNHGPGSVDLFAPGVGILSTLPGNDYDSWNGTSMAAPFVTGVAAALWSKYPSLSFPYIKGLILNGVERKPGLAGTCLTEGRLNFRNSLTTSRSRPAVFAISPQVAEKGATVTIWGINFGDTPGQVTLTGKSLPIKSWKPQKITATVPTTVAYGTYKLQVWNQKGDKSAAVWFKVATEAAKVGETLIGHGWAAAAQAGDDVWIMGGGTDWGQTGIVEKCTLGSSPRCVIDSQWMMPIPLTNTAAVLFNGEIWVIGGLDWNTDAVSNKVQIFNPATGTWRMGPQLPEPRCQTAVFSYSNKVYVVGGLDSTDAVRNTVYVYDASTKTWATGSPKPTPTAYSIAGRIGTSSTFLVGGGFVAPSCGFETNGVEKYNPATDTWEVLPNITFARGGAGALSADGNVFALMGNCGDLRSDGEVFKGGTWTVVVEAPQPLYTPLTGQRGDYAYVLGGVDFTDGFSRNIYRFMK
ncbi:MAG: S8 family serine peptidase [Desulfosoma sp.]